MPPNRRVQWEHTEDWLQIKQRCLWLEQRHDELVRLVVLYGDVGTGPTGLGGP